MTVVRRDRMFVVQISLLVVSSLFMMTTGQETFAQAGTDAKSRDLLIDKLSRVYINLAPSDSSKVPITLRLADLHSERARAESMKELEAGCTKCTAGREDRLKALALYREVLNKVPDNALGKVLTQVGHLYEMTGNEKEAVGVYEKIVSENKTVAAVSEAHLSLGEVFFKRREYQKARAHFQAVVDQPQSASRGLASYRIAWCDFNENRLEVATQGLIKILRTPELLARSASADGGQPDRQFQEEVSRDLATFLARRPVTVKDAELIFELSPEQARLANLTYLANETERLGQVQASIALWRFAQEKQARPQARLEGHVHLAQLEMQQKLSVEAARDFEMALGLWSQMGVCSGAECNSDQLKGEAKELKVRLRNFVVDWNRAEKKSPSEPLLSAYRSYLKVFPTEADMTVGAARVAQDLKQYGPAQELYLRGAQLGADDKSKEGVERFEGALLGAVEVAELSKEPAQLNAAYDSYLAMSRERKKALDVQYQKAHLIYDKGDNAAAAVALREVAFSKEAGDSKLKKQAADLSLDALVLLKDDTRLEAWAGEYAKAFPKEAKDFTSIARKSVLTQTTQVAKADTPEALTAAWTTLSRFDVSQASADEKITFYKNKLILAEKLHKFGDARVAADGLLNQSGLAATDREFALTRKAWLAELVLDFDTALKTTEASTTGEKSQRNLKLAMYAELASKDAKPFYGAFLKDSKDDEKNAAIAAQLVRDSKEPMKEIEKNRALLIKRPDVLADLYLAAYAAAPTLENAKRALATPQVASTTAGKAIARSVFLDEVSKERAKITAHQLDSSNQKKMAQTLKARVQMLDEVEKLASRAVSTGDWTSQLVALDLLGKQSERFYQEILSLPLPQGLSPEDEQQYLSLLSQQAAPHQLRAADIAKKTSEFWADEKAMAQIDEAVAKESGPRRSLVIKEVQALADVAPETKKARLSELAASKPETLTAKNLPSMAQLEQARQEVRENPLSKTSLETLLTLERKLNRPAMVSYLENRIQTLPADGSAGSSPAPTGVPQ